MILLIFCRFYRYINSNVQSSQMFGSPLSLSSTRFKFLWLKGSSMPWHHYWTTGLTILHYSHNYCYMGHLKLNLFITVYNVHYLAVFKVRLKIHIIIPQWSIQTYITLIQQSTGNTRVSFHNGRPSNSIPKTCKHYKLALALKRLQVFNLELWWIFNGIW